MAVGRMRACALATCGLIAGLLALPASGLATPPVDVDMSCLAPAGNAAPGTPEWQQRDTDNQRCSTLRLRDQFLNPAFGHGNLLQGAGLWVDPATQQADEPGPPHRGFTTLVPGSQASDPMRTIKRWTEA